VSRADPSGSYDLVLVGTGPASAFFLLRYLETAGPGARVLVLERGARRDHAWQLANPRALKRASERQFVNENKRKSWVFGSAFGGSMNLWWASTPRLLPEDFEMHSRYGVGRDWPVRYEDLEPYYSRAEQIMSIAGPSDPSPVPRSAAYPQAPHTLSDPEELLRKAYPDRFFPAPCARPTNGTPRGRPACCASGVCGLCPIDSKFTISNELSWLFRDERVELVDGAQVESLDVASDVVTRVVYRKAGRTRSARGEVVALGANAIFNPFIMLRSGLAHPKLGAGLHEQIGVSAGILLDGVEGFQGSTAITGHGYMLYGGAHRARRAAVLLESQSLPSLRNVRGKWRWFHRIKCIVEDLPQDHNRVVFDASRPSKPRVRFRSRTAYAGRTLDEVETLLAAVLAPLPVEAIEMKQVPAATEGHILGTTVMGSDPKSSVIDANLVHHTVRNLVVLGGGAFPTSSPSNPTLTIAALSLRSAQRVLGSGHG
jgi:choline dehydrogenase-like flavoprotein